MDSIKSFVVNLVINYVVKNWRTTVIGAIDFAASHLLTLTPDQQMQLHSFALLAIAFFAKDGGTTGTAMSAKAALSMPSAPANEPIQSDEPEVVATPGG